ncbi:glycosyltransferase [Salegentibacter maritimus]|uniref:Glycosyltransferase n=1 Tax=Salegentibacter maritimus TaxID=2794347 RepID=A0ABS0TBZ1_9FLAO|nr:glycosyltransferase [Salegentibacter maritimus]MBI6118552.1 glycosyltransferase [Salegentibacter maritimus]
MPNIAIISPSQNAYSETFIQEHKKLLTGEKYYYYGSLQNRILEDKGSLLKNRKKLIFKLKRKILNKSHSWYYLQFLLDSFRKNDIQVVLAEYGPTGQQILPVVKELNLPLIVHFHGFDASVTQIKEKNNNYKELFDYASSVIVVSRKMYKVLMDIGCPKNKLIYNVYGPNDAFFKVKPQFLKDQFIAVGRFVDKKAPYYLILSFSIVIKEYQQAKLFIAGEGALWNTCKNLITALNLENNIFLLGVISPDTYRKYLSESLSFVQHSVVADNGDSEGTPVAILEASAAGIPVIATYHAGIPDVIINGETGLLVEEHDYIAMAERMKDFLRNKEYAKKLGKKGKKIIRDNFSLDRHIKVLDGLISRAL